MDPLPSALLTDLYQMTMIEAYLESGQTDTAVFEFFVRKLPPQRSFLMAAGLEQALDFLQNIRFSQDELGWLERTEKFSKSLIDYLANFRFTGEVHAMPEGTVFFGNEPILRVTAPLPEAQLVETRLINILHFQTLIASKAARMVLLAPDKLLVDFGLRRSHGAEAGLLAARASYVAGFSGTATLLAEKSFGIPTYGTMAHSFVQSFDDEAAAFEAFARARPENLVLLIDTYDTEAAARKVVMLAPRLKELGIAVSAVRLDSGDLSALAKKVRCILDSGGLKDTGIFVSGGIEEGTLIAFARDAAPIDGIGIGTGLVTSSDAPALDCAYKLQEYAGLPRRKRSTGKATWPGRKQVWRRYDRKGRMLADILSTEEDQQEGETLIQAVMLGGRPIASQPSLHDIRAHARRQLDLLPPELRTSKAVAPYPVQISSHLEQLAAVADRIGSRP
ncbi:MULTISPECIES: nicotinate phosphoribosyltransferase [unclassified Bradyrhizobium]|uniref:nicotinate phosphoribosyltransferase n=1 Tax=unclassified Bradyrhizobium TaxID=2631580 RepID=UPI002916660F|nr:MULTISPECIES: nicotinate phosphoribosyltransferase [unclassified Bradyrhizobium]